jgi:thiamine pyrophosphate-dependent acetolactate synthase large subunit-like protein
MHFHEALARGISSYDVDTVFGVLGDGNVYIMDSFRRYANGRYVSTSHEMAAILAASGYAHVAGRLGVATVTEGPGLTHCVTALTDAARARRSLLVIAGDVPVTDRARIHKISQRDVVAPTGAGFELVRSPRTVLTDLDTAVRRALVEHRPVVLSVPGTFQWEQVADRPVMTRYPPPQAVRPDPAALDVAVGMLASASRPLVLGGQGAVQSRAGAALLRLAKRLGAPAATTLLARGLFTDYDYNLGVFGTFSSQPALEAIATSDCVIAFGASLNAFTTDSGSLLKKKRVIQVDADPAAIGRHTPVSAAVVGDAAAVADTIVEWLDQAEIQAGGFCSDALARKLKEFSPAPAADDDPSRKLDIPWALARLNEVFTRERTVVFDGGRFFLLGLPQVDVPDPAAYVHTTSFASIGLGMGHAIGAAIGQPGRRTLLISGDGGFMNGGLAEFVTAVRHELDITVVILNDGAYGSEIMKLRRHGLDPDICTFDWPDLGPVAAALGGRGFTVHHRRDFDLAIEEAAHAGPPTLIDVRIDPHTVSFSGPDHAPRDEE